MRGRDERMARTRSGCLLVTIEALVACGGWGIYCCEKVRAILAALPAFGRGQLSCFAGVWSWYGKYCNSMNTLLGWKLEHENF